MMVQPRMRKALLWGALLVLMIALMAFFVRGMLSDEKPSKRPVIQQISLLKPPPPPKPEEKPPEPEVKKEEVKIDQPKPDDAPKPADNEPPAGKDLGVDADGGAGDSFGLVGRKGGRDLLGGVGGKYAGFTTLLRQQIQETLARDKRLRSVDYKAVVKLWLARDGRVERFELAGTTGSPDTDKAINLALANLPPVREQPPEDMPQPVKLRIISRL